MTFGSSSRRQHSPRKLLVNKSLDYTDNHVDEGLHAALGQNGIDYDSEVDGFCAELDVNLDEKALCESRRAFSDALEEYQKKADEKYKSEIDLKSIKTWDDVLKQVEIARDEYQGVGKEGVVKSIRNGLRSFSSAAPAIEAWLKLLPSTSVYGSVVCGGITILLEAAVRLKKLRKETLDALEQIPFRVERAGILMWTYKTQKTRKQATDLFLAIIEVLQDILSWYRKKAGIKYAGSFCKGAAYATRLQEKMKTVENASQAMDGRAGLSHHVRLKEIRDVTRQTNSRLDRVESSQKELKNLALEARNRLYNILRDRELSQEAIQGSSESKEAKRRDHTKTTWKTPDEKDPVDRDSIIMLLGDDQHDLKFDVEDALLKYASSSLADQNRAATIFQNPKIDEWLIEPKSRAVLVHANGRRHETVSPASAACAMIVQSFEKTISYLTLYWFCGSHIRGKNGDALGMMRSLIWQLLHSLPSGCVLGDQSHLDIENIQELIDLFAALLREIPKGTATLCLVDGISYYETSHQRRNTFEVINSIVVLTQRAQPVFKVMFTSPTRTSYIHKEFDMEVVDIDQQIYGLKQEIDHYKLLSITKRRVNKLSKNLGEGPRGVQKTLPRRGKVLPRKKLTKH